jgi:hypothetical protein
VTESQKFDHEMIRKYRVTLDRKHHAVSNHISVISRLAGRFRCRRPRFDHLFELAVYHNRGKQSLPIRFEEADDPCPMNT